MTKDFQRAELDRLLHLLNYADGTLDLLDIASLKNESIFNFSVSVANATEKGILVK
jgi:aminopeptidase-like protein